MRRLLGLAAVLVLAGCGGSKTASTPTGSTASVTPSVAEAMQKLINEQPALAGKVTVLYDGADWAVAQSADGKRASAVAFRLEGGAWVPDRSGAVEIRILGPDPATIGAPRVPQVAIQFTAPTPFVESSIWVDGKDLVVKGGGSPTRGTIFGAPAKPLKPGVHVAVGYARSAANATAVAWVFSVV